MLRGIDLNNLPELTSEELALLLRLGERLLAKFDLQGVLSLVAVTACEVVQAETLAVPMIDADYTTFTYRAACGKYAEMVVNQTFPIDEGTCGWVLKNQRPLLFGEGGEFEINLGSRWQPGMASSLLVPLICRGKIIGGLSAMGKQGGGAFNLRDLTVLTLFANQASIAIDNARLFQQLTAEGARLRLILESAAEAIYGIDAAGCCTFANPACLRMLGYDSESELIGKPMHETVHHTHADGTALPLEKCHVHHRVRYGDVAHADTEIFWRQDQSSFPVEYWAHPALQEGQVVGAVITFIDITRRKTAEAQQTLAASVFANISEGVIITDTKGSLLDVNQSFSRITGYSRSEVLGKNPRFLKSGKHDPSFYEAMWCSLSQKGFWSGEIWNRRKSGEVYPESLSIKVVTDDAGKTQHFVALFSDITIEKAYQEQLEHRAHYDCLTELPNRILLADRLNQAMRQEMRRGKLLAVAYLDLDGFKEVNDQYGHNMGDTLLINLANRMKEMLREGDTIARMGGDEFAVVLLDLSEPSDCIPLLERILKIAAQPVIVDETTLQVSASLGVTFYPQVSSINADQLLRQSDQAMYQAKQSGKNCYHLFDTEQEQQLRGCRQRLERIREGLVNDEFILYYQPKVNMHSGKVVGAEALIRWQHPEKGLLQPADFLHYAENSPYAILIDEWVMRTGMWQIEQWQLQGLNLAISLNVSPINLQQADFVERLQSLLEERSSIDRTLIELEVLETGVLSDIPHVSKAIEACKKLGIQFALDDFGTGYSSLAHLRRLPARTLKIDRTFVRDMLENPDDLAILEGVVGLASSFGLKTVAEGVESIDHGEILLFLGCELGQGYGIARPMPAAELAGWVEQWQADPRWLAANALHRDDIPLLYAVIDHRAWVNTIGDCVEHGCILPPLDAELCRFAQWLNGKGAERFGSHPLFETICELHHQVHELSAEIIIASSDETDAMLRQLYALRDRLIAQLFQLIY
ncbi:MAG: EAL domain-containing protein [Gammaproteobacteria bacterium]|nr:EAL domain-containing protein [Gammaproteobacteria bacterium]